AGFTGEMVCMGPSIWTFRPIALTRIKPGPPVRVPPARWARSTLSKPRPRAGRVRDNGWCAAIPADMGPGRPGAAAASCPVPFHSRPGSALIVIKDAVPRPGYLSPRSMSGRAMQQAATETYNDKVVRQFAVMTVVWGIVGMTVGVLISAQLYWPDLTKGISWLSYGRLRPLHTNAVIFAFGGSALFATSLHVVQRTCHVRLLSDRLAAFVFWGWQAVIVAAAITLPLGLTQGKEYAELEWPVDLLITVVWVAYAVLFFGT